MLGGVRWVVVICLLGYAFGHAMELALENVRKYELWIILGLIAVGSAAGACHLLLRRREQYQMSD